MLLVTTPLSLPTLTISEGKIFTLKSAARALMPMAAALITEAVCVAAVEVWKDALKIKVAAAVTPKMAVVEASILVVVVT